MERPTTPPKSRPDIRERPNVRTCCNVHLPPLLRIALSGWQTAAEIFDLRLDVNAQGSPRNLQGTTFVRCGLGFPVHSRACFSRVRHCRVAHAYYYRGFAIGDVCICRCWLTLSFGWRTGIVRAALRTIVLEKPDTKGQVQEEMKNLKIINRSGEEIQLVELVDTIQIGEIITVRRDSEHNYPCNRYLEDKSIRLDLPSQHSVDRSCIYLNGDFMETNKIAYVRKGAGDRWFVDPIPRGAKLVRKRVCNSTHAQIAVAEFASEQIGKTRRVPGRIDPPPWTAWWEIQIPERKKNLLVVDPGNKDRKYFGRRGGEPLVGSNADIRVLRQQNNNENIHEIKIASHDEHVEVKEIPGGLLDLISSWRPPFLV
ncbi:unnamed protein product [Sphagnum troendelagicum]